MVSMVYRHGHLKIRPYKRLERYLVLTDCIIKILILSNQKGTEYDVVGRQRKKHNKCGGENGCGGR